MKKLLALVLALVMSMSLVTISNAADFSDADSIDYKEAVAVMKAVGVIDGYTDGSFGPKDTLTRAQAAKIIAYLDMGKDVADALVGTGKVFSDVPATNWAAGYIEYLAQANIVSGIGDGKFGPDEKLTGLQFAKMLLVVLGYDQKLEEMTGSAWEINVAKLAAKNDLFKGISAKTNVAYTREQAAQMGLNALKADVVKYDNKGTNITIGDANIAVGASEAKASDDVVKTSNGNEFSYTGTADQKLQLCEQRYGEKLALGNAAGDDADKFGRPTKAWKYEGKTVATTTSAADYTYYGKVDAKTLYVDLGLTATKPVTFFNVYTDGNTASTNAQNPVVKNNDATVLGGNNKSVELYANKDNTGAVTSYDVYEITYYIDKISSVTEADEDVTDSKRYVTVNSLDFETESFAKDEYVLYAQAQGDVAGSDATIVKKADSISGTVESIKGSKVTISGTTYGFYDYAPAIGDTGVFYLGVDGKIAKEDLTAADTGAYAYIYTIVKKSEVNSTGVIGTDTYTAYYVTESGVLGSAEMKTKTVGTGNNAVTYVAYFDSTHTGIDVSTLNANNGVNAAAYACEYKISDGKFVALSGVKATVTEDLADNILATANSNTVAGYSNSATKFVFFYTNSDNEKVVKVKVAGEFDKFTSSPVANIAVVTNSKNIATYVFVPAAPVATTSDKTVAYLLDATPTVTKSGDDTIYTYSVMADAKVTTLAWKNTVTMTGISVGDPFVYTLKDGYLDSANGSDSIIVKNGDQLVDAVLDNSIVVDGTDYKLADNCATYKVTTKDGVSTYGNATVEKDNKVILITNDKTGTDLRIVAIIIDKR